MKLTPLILVITSLGGFAQSPSKQEQKTTHEAQKGEEQYIPTDLDDCFRQLKKILKPEDIHQIRNRTEKDMSEYHFGLGMWLRNNWGLWAGSRLAKWFNEKGVFHPDDMSGVILDSFWRHLNEKPIDLEGQVKGYQQYWKQQEQQTSPSSAPSKK